MSNQRSQCSKTVRLDRVKKLCAGNDNITGARITILVIIPFF